MRRKKANRRKTRRISSLFVKTFKILLVAALLGGTVYIVNKWIRSSHLFMLKQFDFEGNIIIEDTQLFSLVKNELSKNIFQIDTKNIILVFKLEYF